MPSIKYELTPKWHTRLAWLLISLAVLVSLALAAAMAGGIIWAYLQIVAELFRLGGDQ